MRRESGWTSVAVWLVLLAFAFACGVLVVGQAFDAKVLALTGRSLRLSADYSADPRVAREQKIAPVDSAVISDTVRDQILEQTQAPLIIFAHTPVILSPTPRPFLAPPQRTATPTRAVASATATAQSEPLTATATLESIAAPPDERDTNRPRATRTPTRVPALPPPPTVRPSRPIATSTARPVAEPDSTAVPPTNTPVPPTDTPVPPTDTPVPPTDTPVPPTDTPAPPTDTPAPPTDTPVPPTDTPAPPPDTPVPPTDTPVPPTDTPAPPP
ncbi:MAG TPA: hypothetical protein VFU22_33615 [Roseiflexaceae bacterium]|nr:hypothetical protein [Roseiflexaceae bacterium]